MDWYIKTSNTLYIVCAIVNWYQWILQCFETIDNIVAENIVATVRCGKVILRLEKWTV